MASQLPKTDATLDLSKWRNVPNRLIAGGVALVLLGLVASWVRHGDLRQFAFSWLTAFMFCLSFCLGAMFLVLAHHLFDASWSVPIRRICENIASLVFPQMLILFLPIAALAAPCLYEWMRVEPHADHAVSAKWPLFTIPGFYITSAACFLAWTILARGLRKWSIAQDATGAAECTYKMRLYSYVGIFVYAFSLTLASIMWMKALQHQWFSTMYGVQYYAGSVWTALATVYVITMMLSQLGVITHVLHKNQFYYIGSLLFAFTVFYAYVTFSQYFIIWNANMPEEIFWYKQRENGLWWWVSMVIIFGHFFVPFLGLLRIDVKESFKFMVPMAAWAWLMQYTDMAFNVGPALHPLGFAWKWAWLDLGCVALMMGILIKGFLSRYAGAAPYPLKDPRLLEAMGLSHPVSPAASASSGLVDGQPRTHGGHH